MTKIIIISYFYPPSNFVGGDRVASWVRDFNKFGIYPIVITRNWNKNQTNVIDKVLENEYSVEKTEYFEIHRMPYKFSLRDRFALNKSFRFLSKLLTLKELILSNYFIGALPYSNFYRKASDILTNNDDVEMIIVSGGPFPQFAIGSKLAKKYNVNWYPDYRDEWTSHNEKKPKSIVESLIHKLNKKAEKKYTANATSFTTVSPKLKETLENYICKQGKVIMNGYEEFPKTFTDKTSSAELRLLYVGTLYMYQDMNPIVNAVIKANEQTSFAIRLTFVGVEIVPEAHSRLIELTKDYPQLFEILPRLPKNELLPIYEKTDVFYLSNYQGNVGWLPVKLFEYYSLKKIILLYPTDNDTMEEFIENTKSGYYFSSEIDCVNQIVEWVNLKKNGDSLETKTDYSNIEIYSRSYQSKLLAEFILNNKKC